MTTVERDFDRLFADELDAIAAERNYLLEAQKRLESEFVSSMPPMNRLGVKHYALIAAAAVLALVLGVGLYSMHNPADLTASIQGSDETVSAGAWISSATRNELSLAFSDGSTVELDENTELRVQELRRRGAHLLLERGNIGVSVVHEGHKEWTFDAGPYRIYVTGTRFDVRWIPEEQTFSIDLTQGSVKVEGPMLEEGKALVAGSQVKVSLLNRVAEISTRGHGAKRLRGDVTDIETDPEVVVDDEASSADTADKPQNPTATHTNRGRRSTWRALARKGHFRDAVALLTPGEFARIKSSGTADDLLLIGDATRLSGQHKLAVDAYRTVRRRFPNTGNAGRAAFMLGRILMDENRDPSQAARWFETCYRENPAGMMAREAAGRLIEAFDKAGNTARAKRAAAAYIARYPRGPHSKLAQKILSQSTK